MNICCITPKQKKSKSHKLSLSDAENCNLSTSLYIHTPFFLSSLLRCSSSSCQLVFCVFPRAFPLPQTENTTIYIPIYYYQLLYNDLGMLCYTVTKTLRRQKSKVGVISLIGLVRSNLRVNLVIILCWFDSHRYVTLPGIDI